LVVGRNQENCPSGNPGRRAKSVARLAAKVIEGNAARPSISVITPCLNGARYVREAIDSVIGQRYAGTQHIVVDGGSNDGTLELLGLYPHLKVIKGPDRGVYDALNKGLAAADGEIIGILNSDDSYVEGVFSAVGECMADPGIAALAGDAIAFQDSNHSDPNAVTRFSDTAKDLLYESTLGNPSINAWFFRASVFRRLGGFDADYKVAGDREFMLRLACSGLRCTQLSMLVYRYRIHPASMTFAGNPQIWETVAREHLKMTNDYLRKPDLPKRALNLITRARTRDTLRMALRSARRHEWRRFMIYASAGTRRDLVWPLRFLKRALRGQPGTRPTA
jgi:glycosyltransferase involved in cell wall biosynthesis